MANILKISQNYDNPYEAAYNISKGNPWFNEEDWTAMAKRGKLNDYLTVLGQTDSLPDINTFNETYRPDLLDTTRRFTAMANELYGDKENKTARTEIQFDPVQNQEVEVSLGEMSDYDYTKHLLNQYKDWQLDKIRLKEEQDRKDAMNFLQKSGALLLSVPAELGVGAMDFVDDISSLLEGINDGLNEMGRGGSFTDGFRQAYTNADWRIFDNLGWQNSIREWERLNSGLRDINGNYTNIGKILGGVSYSLGKALPSMALNLIGAGLSKSGLDISNQVGKAATALYYTGLGSGSFYEMVNDPRMTSVPTWQIMTSATVKTAFEYLIQKGLEGVFGQSQLDKLTFGQGASKAIGEASFKGAMKRVAIDFIHEGLEELGQSFSSYLWDQSFGLVFNDKFAQLSEWNMQTAFDAFILGGLSTIATNSLSIITTRRINIGDRKLNQFASWVFKADLQSMNSEFNKILNDNKLSTEQRLDAVGQMYASYRTISSVFGEIGKERFDAATKLLQEMKELEAKQNLTNEQIKINATTIYQSVTDMQIEHIEKVVSNIEKAGMTKVAEVINRGDDIDDNLPDNVKQKAMKTVQAIFDGDKNAQRIILTEDGTTVVSADSAIFVPIKYALSDDGTMIFNTIAEQTLVNNVVADASLKSVLVTLKNIFELVTNRTNVDVNEVVYNLFFNENFYKVALQVSNADMLKVLSSLEIIAKKATDKTIKDSVYKKKLNDSMKAIKMVLANYLVLQPNAEYQHLTMLTKEVKDAIARQRWQLDLGNRIIAGGKLNADDLRLLQDRVNSMPAPVEVKQQVIDGIKDTNKRVRQIALATLERYYRDVFNSPYNGRTYLVNDNVPNVRFNEYIKSQGLTIDTLLQPVPKGELYDTIVDSYGEVTGDTILKYHKDQFISYTNGKYDFNYTAGRVTVIELIVDKQVGYDNFVNQREGIISGHNINELSNMVLRQNTEGLLNNIISNNITPIQKSYMSISDVIFNPNMLTKKMQEAIINEYSDLTPMNAFLYLRKYYLNKYNTISIAILNNGKFAFVDVSPMFDTLKQREINVSMLNDKSMAKDFINDNFLQGRLIDTKIVLGTNTYYDLQSNVITIDQNAAQDPAYLRFALLHEFQHAIQTENQLNGGINENWLNLSGMNKTQKANLIADVKKHKPELFKNVKSTDLKQQLNIVNQFVYDTSGESQAYGVDAKQDVVDFYPTVVRFEGRKTIIVLPWGKKYIFDGSVANEVSLTYTSGTQDSTQLVNELDYTKYIKLENKRWSDLRNYIKTFTDRNNYTKAYDTLRKKLPELDNWARLGVKQTNNLKGTLYTNEKITNERNLKQELVNAITPEIRSEMINVYRLMIAPDMTLDEFMNIDIPYSRIQTVSNDGNTPFVSVTLGTQTTIDNIGKMFPFVKERYVFAGTVKPSQLIGIIPSSEYEGLMSNDFLQENSKVWYGEWNNDTEKLNTLTRIDDNLLQQMSMATRKQPGDHKYKTRVQIGNYKDGTPKYKYTYDHKDYVSNKKATGTNLEYFIKKNRPIQLAKSVQDFIVQADSSRLEPELWSMIGGDQKGTLTKQRIFHFLRTANNINNYTFELINDHFFQNDSIKTFEQLEYLLVSDISQYYALRAILKKIGAGDRTLEQISHAQFRRMINELSAMPELKRQFERLVENYETYKGNTVTVDYENLRIPFMNYFDGSIESAGHVAAIGKMLAITGWKIPGQIKGASMDRIVQGTDKDYGEFIADTTSQDAINYMLLGLHRVEKERVVIENEYAKLAIKVKAMDKMPTKREVMEMAQELRETIEDLTDSELDDYYVKVKIAEMQNHIPTLDELKESAPVVRSERNISKNVRTLASRIKNFIKNNSIMKNDAKRIVELHGDLFNDDLSLKSSVLENVTRDRLLELEELFRQINTDVRNGAYHNKKMSDLRKSLELAQKRLAKERFKNLTQSTTIRGLNHKVNTINFGDYEFTIDTTIPMPDELKSILGTSFDKFVDTDVKFLTNENEKHMQMNLANFLEVNAQRISALTQGDVDSIVNFYLNSLPRGTNTAASYVKYSAFKVYMLAYLLDQSTSNIGGWTLTVDQINGIEMHLKTIARTAGTDLAVWRSVLKLVDPNKHIINSLAKASGIQFSDADVEQVSAAIKTGNVATIRLAISNLYTTGLKLYKGTKKSFWNKAWRLQRLFMLSSPGTAIRNITSNTLLTIGNAASGVIGNLLTKIPAKFRKKPIAGQYKIVGTKVSTEIQSFIQTNIINTKFLNLVGDGLSKYDVRKSSKQTTTDIMTDLLVRSIATKIFNANQFDWKVLQKMSNIVFKMLSDGPFVNRATIKYFGKMLQENNFDVRNGLNEQALITLAEAYTLAARDYMHKASFFNSFENALRKYSGDAAFFMYKQLLPFATASWNWFKEGLMYTPLGLLKGIIDFARLQHTIDKMDYVRTKGGTIETSRFAEYLSKRNIGKGVIGSMGLGIGLLLGGFGVARIDEEDDKMKLKVGDTYVDITSIFGTQSILLGIALTNPRSGDWQGLTVDVLDTLFNDSTLTDLFNTFRYSNNVGDWLLNEPARMLGTTIPNFLKAIAKMSYSHKVQYSPGVIGQFERVATSIPGIAYLYPTKIDPYTGEIQEKYSMPFLYDAVNSLMPFKLAKYNVSEHEKLALELGVRKGNLTGKYNDIGNLKPKDIEKLNIKYGKLNKQSLEVFYSNKSKYRVQMNDGSYKELNYKSMDEAQRKSVTERIMSSNAKYAKIYVYTSNGGNYYASDAEFAILRKLRIPNVYKETVKKKGFN